MVLIKNKNSAPAKYWDGRMGVWVEFKPNEKKELEHFNGTDGFEVILPKKEKIIKEEN